MATFARSPSIDFSRFKWLKPLDTSLLLDVGDRSPDLLSVPTKDAQRVLSETVRLVLDLPRNSTPLVVWTQGDSELLVHSDQTRIGLSSGVVTLRITVECEEHGKLVIPVPIGVGTKQSPTGLVMATFEDLEGPAELVAAWSDAIIAFVWEALLEIARVICAEVGNDKRGLPLVPGSMGASPNRLLLQPVSRFSLMPGA
ncbi:MAG: hypothetical protein KBT82_05720 [Marinobacter sp.]|uniref:hypothetical protein n=1 Tax=Marinobacter sp. TaxID=50741 RepID=UPI001B517F69|nr:hypothetical protein [Marinobacter sp.]MBQ0746433.1 hypothetical protein [Marinobacter sp.]MBQ0813662.1 hypothetical protein [Marinobacter sp.]|tara:strand:+ start:10240 stop:10836 length:597 start_codon:yes stop_codon:yes gene_type:complete